MHALNFRIFFSNFRSWGWTFLIILMQLVVWSVHERKCLVKQYMTFFGPTGFVHRKSFSSRAECRYAMIDSPTDWQLCWHTSLRVARQFRWFIQCCQFEAKNEARFLPSRTFSPPPTSHPPHQSILYSNSYLRIDLLIFKNILWFRS